MAETNCLYCNYDEYDVIAKNDYGVVLPEPNSLSEGHCVVIPLRHVASFFEVTDKERKSLMSLLEQARNELNLRYQPAGFMSVLLMAKCFRKRANICIFILFRAIKTKY